MGSGEEGKQTESDRRPAGGIKERKEGKTMKKRMLICLAVVLCAMLALPGAFAESLTLSGTVVPASTDPVYAPIGGTVESVAVQAGQKVQAGDILYTLKTTKVYADKNGTVTGIFGKPGDDAESVANEYGAVLYIEETQMYSVSASTNNAYSSAETKFVHPGENVWMVVRNNTARKGTGIITSVSDNSYTIQVTDSNFITGDSVDIYRDEVLTSTLRIGRGTVSRISPVAVTATGAIVRIAVENGQQVKKGDLLLETLDGKFDGYVMTGTTVSAAQAGVIGSVSAQAGAALTKGDAAISIYPVDRMLVEATVTEEDCNRIHEGDAVTVEMQADESKVFSGTVVLISSVATEDAEEVSYKLVAAFVPDETIRFGMSAVVTIGQDDEPETKAEEPAKEETAKQTEEAAGETEKTGKHERPEGAPEWPTDGSMPQPPEGTEWPTDGSMPQFPGSSGSQQTEGSTENTGN